MIIIIEHKDKINFYQIKSRNKLFQQKQTQTPINKTIKTNTTSNNF